MMPAPARFRSVLFHLAARRLARPVAAGLRVLARTWRCEVEGARHLAEARSLAGGVLYCFWHGRMLELAVAHADRGVGILVSDHPDGRAAASIVERLGYVPIPMDRWRNPLPGIRAMLAHAAAGADLGAAADAHSPEHRVRPGAIALARRSGLAIVPVAAAARPLRRVDSWDRFEIPWPGARVRVRYGPPLTVPPDADAAARERARRALEASLVALHAGLEIELAGAGDRAAERAGALQGR